MPNIISFDTNFRKFNYHGRPTDSTSRHSKPGRTGPISSIVTDIVTVIFIKFQQAEHFCNSIGVLQQFSVPSKFPGFDRTGSPQQNQQEDYAQLFSTLISRYKTTINRVVYLGGKKDFSSHITKSHFK